MSLNPYHRAVRAVSWKILIVSSILNYFLDMDHVWLVPNWLQKWISQKILMDFDRLYFLEGVLVVKIWPILQTPWLTEMRETFAPSPSCGRERQFEVKMCESHAKCVRLDSSAGMKIALNMLKVTNTTLQAMWFSVQNCLKIPVMLSIHSQKKLLKLCGLSTYTENFVFSTIE